MNIIIAILIFSFIVFFHELGHFITAKRCGVRVNEFCLGLGPKVFGIKKGETEYALRLLPFGGACMMEGEDEESDDEAAFGKKPLWQRALICFAGPGFNFILAYILAIVILAFVGVDKPYILEVSEGFPAKEAGILPGDEIIALNGHRIYFYREISIYTFFHGGENPIEVTYNRDGEKGKVTFTPQYSEEAGRYLLGVVANPYREKVNIIETLGYGFCELRYQISNVFSSLRMLIMRRVSINEMSGPVGIVKAIGDTYEESKSDGVFYVVMNLLSFTVLLSANLGVMNLLPIPALDGGRLFIFLIEAIRRKPINERLEGIIHIVGFVLLMALMVVVLFNDIRKLF